jgi:hypothetical protein
MARPSSLAGKELVQASYRLLRQDKQMVLLLFLGGLAASISLALISGVGALIDPGAFDDSSNGVVAYVFFAVGLLVSTFLSTFFLGAIVAAANQRADGQDPTVNSALSAAWERKGALFAWAILTTVVGLVLRQLERFGAAGAVIRFIGGAAWAVATIFAVPVIMAENASPFEAVKRSGSILKNQFGTNVRAGVRLGVQWFLALFAALLVLAGGIALIVAGAGADTGGAALIGAGILVAIVGAIGLVVVGAIYAAVSAYLRTLLYRHSVGKATPGVDNSFFPTPTAAGAQ